MEKFRNSIVRIIIVLATMLGSLALANPTFAQQKGADVIISNESTSDTIVLTTTTSGITELYVQGKLVAATESKFDNTYKLTNGKTSVPRQDMEAFEVKYANSLKSESALYPVEEKYPGWFEYHPVQTSATPVAQPTAAPESSYNLNGEEGKFVDCAMWHVSPTDKTLTWTGGSGESLTNAKGEIVSGVHVCFNDAAKALLKQGFVAGFTFNVPFETRACRSIWNGTDIDGNTMTTYNPSGCEIQVFRAGTYYVHGWAFDEFCRDQVGFRAIPYFSSENMTFTKWDETPTCTACIWPFPKAQMAPHYSDQHASSNPTSVVLTAAEPTLAPTAIATSQVVTVVVTSTPAPQATPTATLSPTGAGVTGPGDPPSWFSQNWLWLLLLLALLGVIAYLLFFRQRNATPVAVNNNVAQPATAKPGAAIAPPTTPSR